MVQVRRLLPWQHERDFTDHTDHTDHTNHTDQESSVLLSRSRSSDRVVRLVVGMYVVCC